MSKIEVNTIETASGSTLTVGKSGDTVTLASGASQSGFGRSGAVDWQTVIVADGSTVTTSESGKGYIIDTRSYAHTINLPSSPSAGDIVAVYQSGSNAVTVGRNSSNIESGTSDISLTSGAVIELVYSSSATIGWIRTNNDVPEQFVEATGGTETTSGSYKVHTFNSSGNFVVSTVATTPANNNCSYIVVAGGGGGGGYTGGGGGGGGFREGTNPADPYSPAKSPLASTPIALTAQTYPITVGAGGTAGAPTAGRGSNSVFSTITSTGGGAGKGNNANNGSSPGGSGGGGTESLPSSGGAGSGNTPPVSPSQGNNGGTGSGPGPCNDYREEAGGGGGATAVGGNGTNQGPSTGNGGAGATTSISGSPTAYAGGGGGGKGSVAGGGIPQGGAGGGGNGSKDSTEATAGSSNTGGGGGGSGASPSHAFNGKAGGSGVVIIRYRYQ